MPLSKPYYRICRPSLNSGCFSDPTWGYAQDRRFVDPREKSSLLSAAKLILKDFEEILEFVEPCDDNLSTYSHRIYELLLRTCTEVEANLEGESPEGQILCLKTSFRVEKSSTLD